MDIDAQVNWRHMSFSYIDELPEEEGIYSFRYSFRDEEDIMLYIGRSFNLRERVYSQRKLMSKCRRDKTEDNYHLNVSYMYFVTDNSVELERLLIEKYSPAYNKVHNKLFRRTKKVIHGVT